MEKQRIAIVGLGRIGSAFLQQMLARKGHGIELVCASEFNDTPGRRMAEEAGVPLKTLEEIIEIGKEIDVVFDLTGTPTVRRQLRERFAHSHNLHTVIASESIMRVIWCLITDEALPTIAGRATGYSG